MFAMLTSAGVGLLATSTALAAPASGGAIGDAATIFQATPVAQCQGPKFYQCRHYTYTSVRRCGWWRRNYRCY
jgi:hypothetical protein